MLKRNIRLNSGIEIQPGDSDIVGIDGKWRKTQNFKSISTITGETLISFSTIGSKVTRKQVFDTYCTLISKGIRVIPHR